MKKSLLETMIKELRNEADDIPKGWMTAAQIAEKCGRHQDCVDSYMRRSKVESKEFNYPIKNGVIRKQRFYNVT